MHARRRCGDTQIRNGRGRAGLRRARTADRPHDSRRRHRRSRHDRHADRLRRVDLRLATDMDERRRSRRCVSSRARETLRARGASAQPRSPATRCRGNGNRRHTRSAARLGCRGKQRPSHRTDLPPPSPADRGARRKRPRKLPRCIRLRRTPRRGRRRHRTGSRQGRPNCNGARRRSGVEPARFVGPDRRRDRPGSRTCRDGGDSCRSRSRQEPEFHRLSPADGSRCARCRGDSHRRVRTARSARRKRRR